MSANDTEWTASARSVSAMEWASGTSLSGPLVAGVLAESLSRIHGGSEQERVPPASLRSAMSLTAATLETAGWDPTHPATNPTLANLASTSVAVVPAQMG